MLKLKRVKIMSWKENTEIKAGAEFVFVFYIILWIGTVGVLFIN